MNNISQSIFTDPNYRHYIAQYLGDIENKLKNIKGYYVLRLNDKYVIISTKKTVTYEALINMVIEEITFIEKISLYSLESIDPKDAANITTVQDISALNLTGEGVLVGVIDTGINFLNKAFIDDSGKSRVECIWDQTLIKEGATTNIDPRIPFGTMYSEEEINKALEVFKNGGDPYEIVASKDEIGHGTRMAGIIGGRNINPDIRGGAPNCTYVAVKLVESEDFKEELKPETPLYNLISAFSAVNFIVNYALSRNKPLVIYLPLGSNFSDHKGNTLLEAFIDDISVNRGVVVVTGTGNEGNIDSHTSGVIPQIGNYKDIKLYVDPKQENIAMQIWIKNPNIMSINIVSPSGEETGIIPAFLNLVENNRFIFEETNVSIKYYLPEESSGDELIELYFMKIRNGIWKIRLTGDYILDGRFDAWLPQRGVTVGNTKFIGADPYGTFTSPGPSPYIINVACYDQTTNGIVGESGLAFETDLEGRVDVAAGGVNVMTTDISGDGYSVVTGTSVSAAVVVSACALLLEWGIVKGNSPNMYSQRIKTFIIRGTKKRQGDIYPNPEWGYGILDMFGVFRNMT